MRLAEQFLGLVSTLVLARLLVPEDFGLIAMATSLAAILGAISAFGFEWAIIQKRVEDRRYFDTAWSLNVILGVGNAIALLALAQPAAAFYNEPRVVPVILAIALAAVIGGFRNIGMVKFEQELEFSRIVALHLGRKLASVVATISFAFYIRNYWALVAGLIVGGVIDVIMSYALHAYRARFSLSAWRELFGFSKWLLLNNLLYFLSNRGCDFITGSRAGPAALGTYSMANEFANLPTTELVYPIMRAVYPGYAKLAAQRADLAQGFRMVFGAVAIFAVPAGAGIACLSDVIVDVLLGEKWAEAAPLMAVLALLGALRAVQANTGSVYVALGEPRFAAILTGAYVFMSLPLFAIALSTHGLLAATWVLVACYCVITVANFALLIRKTDVTTGQVLGALVRPMTATGLMLGAVLLVKETWRSASSVSGVGTLVALIMLGAVVYAVSLLLLWVLSGRPMGAESTILDAFRGLARRRSRQEPS